MKFGLENMSRLSAALGHPERTFDSVVIAGTNGKGSVTAMVHQALTAAGHVAARYISPHLERLEERYVIGASEVRHADLEQAAGTVRAAVEGLQRSGTLDALPTFFECATAIAFVLFRAAGVRIAVLEVGLGGRLDATNIVAPIAAAITSIDFDHQAQLGDTLAAIAWEKAGVIKPGIPVVCGTLPPPAERVIRGVCDERSAPFVPANDCADWPIFAEVPIALPGAHQRENAKVAVCLLKELEARGIRVGDDAIRSGLADVEWPGRLELVRYRDTDVLLDAAHNPAGARALAAYLRSAGWTDATLVFGVMADKDVAAMLAELAPICPALVCTTPDTPRALDAGSVAAIARRLSGAWTISLAHQPAAALASAVRSSRRVVVCGSIFLIGPVRGILRPR